MSILGVNGSPRPAGNTGVLVQEVLRGAAEAGAPTTMFQLGRMNVSPCIDCAACRPTARCTLNDDNQQFYAAVAEAQTPKAMVIGTPIYLDHVSAQLKAWLDRFHAYNGTQLGKHMFPEGFKAALIITYGAPAEDRYASVLDWLTERLEGLKYATVVDRIVFHKACREPVQAPEELMAKAYRIGRRLATGE